MSPRSRSLPYMPQLDALRAAAVTIVVLRHFTSRVTLERVVATDLGVRLFFVLSGFLITSLLLLARDECRSGVTTTRAAARQFYVRRFLRIAPIYYGTLFVAAACGLAGVVNLFWWHFAYLSNVAFSIGRESGSSSHFWTLAIEEQFYLVWPWIVLTTSTSLLRRISVFAIVSALIYRIVAIALGYPEFARLFTFGALDALAAGAVMATYWHERRLDQILARTRRWFIAAFVATAVLLVAGAAGRAPFDSVILTLETLLLVPLVGHAALGVGGTAGRVLESKPLRYVGKISYGIYVYHMFMPHVVQAAGRVVGVAVPREGASAVLMLVCATLIVSAASWTLVERPLLRLKDRMQSVSAPASAAA